MFHYQKPSLTTANRERIAFGKWWLKAVFAFSAWTILGLLFSTRAYFLWPEFTWGGAMLLVMPQCYAWGLLAPFIFAADRRLLGSLPTRRRILGHLPLGVLCMLAAVGLDYAIQKALHAAWLPASTTYFFLQNVTGAAMSYALIAGVSIAVSYATEARRRESEAAQLALHSAQLETRLAEARLGVLQSQLNPHFLFNAFNTISALTEIDPKAARRMMAHLAKLLRSSLDHAGRQEVTLDEELAFLDDYLTIERLRFEDRLTIDVQVEDDVRSAIVPSFVLQPLVENAIRHGTAPRLRIGHVQVSGRRADSQLMLRVEDDGVGLPEGWRLEDHAGVGLSNVARRLAALYGGGQTFNVSGRAEGGVRADITLPYRAAQTAPATPHAVDDLARAT